MTAKRRFRGPAGAMFVPAETVTEQTIKRYVESGEWTPVADEKPEPEPDEKPRPVKRSPRKKSN